MVQIVHRNVNERVKRVSGLESAEQTAVLSTPWFVGAGKSVANSKAYIIPELPPGSHLNGASSSVIEKALAPKTPLDATSTLPIAPTDPNTAPSLDDVFNELTGASIPILPEQIGYLKSLGLDYGKGPTAMMEWLLEHVHVWTGSPWWLSILLTGVIVRTIFLRPIIRASDVSARIAAMKPVTQSLADRIKEAQLSRDQVALMKARSELTTVYQRAGIANWKIFIPMLQVFPGFGIFRLLRGMADLPVPGLENGGVLWIQDLTLGDPYYTLPLATGLIYYWTLKAGGETGAVMLSPTTLKVITYGLPCATVVFALTWPSALQLSFAFNALWGMLQGAALRNPRIRDGLGMVPLVPPAKPGSSSSASHPENLNIDPRVRSQDSGSADHSATAAPPSKPKGFIDGAYAEVTGVVKEARKTWDKMTGANRTAGRRTARERREAQAYEKRRRREIERQKWEKQYGERQ